ncbi:alpha-N-acetylgalactosaminidase-like isoform X1 [Haliotis rufescens]|uniref:alpha-N-acetylgalactosaminidase-like isoform X1 n=1 Tax=Haliotis rufescens TaxID=6454 RepID=UPI00201FAE82|nr:alpha-N-acetylgalactosaminidase-like isoform X1 [Haliotis rufescens]XP_046375045.2 alpha-N-acetylgalactosaminidase-like isoform X1 [Haliotis rufescens]
MEMYLCLLLLCGVVHGLNNGLARTPPMGFLSWERFRCNLDCKNDPENCVSEHLYKSIADVIVAEGYRDLGYEYVNIDDCWPAKTRDAAGRLQPDPNRFPSGMHNLSQYMHARGLKLGIYEDFGKRTCAGYPGSEFFLRTDANTFAEWEIDLLKFDGCNSDPKDMDIGYPLMEFFLNQTGRPFLFSCSWPAYIVGTLKKVPNYTAIKEHCNIWRNYDDIQDSWDSALKIIDYYGENKGNFAGVAGPGGFNDPDELLVGDFGLSYDQQKVQFGMWAMMASPLFISTDLRKIKPEFKAILQNKRVIAINQDPLGAQATQLYKASTIQVWLKPLAVNGTLAVAILNTDNQGEPAKITLNPKQIGALSPNGVNITETFDNIYVGAFKPTETFTLSINPTGIFLATVVPLA